MYYIYAVFWNYSSYIVYYFSYLVFKRSAENNKRLLFNAFICSFLLFCAIASFESGNNDLHFIVIIPMLALLVMIPFAIVALMFGLFLNAKF